MNISWARLASFCHLGFIRDPLIVSKFHNGTNDPKGQENKIYTIVKGREMFYHRHTVLWKQRLHQRTETRIYTIVKGREMFYRRHTVPVTSCSESNMFLKGYPLEAKTAPTLHNNCSYVGDVDLLFCTHLINVFFFFSFLRGAAFRHFYHPKCLSGF